jgi:hypothetical protein
MSYDRPGEDRAPITELDTDGLLSALTAHDVAFVVIGGLSLAAHGLIRATKDLDVVPDPAPANRARLARALADLDAEILLAEDFDPQELGIEPDESGLALGGNWVLRTRLGRLDVLQDVPGVADYAQLSAGAVSLAVPGVGEVRFAGLTDIIAMKTAAGRPQDLMDLQRLRELERDEF